MTVRGARVGRQGPSWPLWREELASSRHPQGWCPQSAASWHLGGGRCRPSCVPGLDAALAHRRASPQEAPSGVQNKREVSMANVFSGPPPCAPFSRSLHLPNDKTCPETRTWPAAADGTRKGGALLSHTPVTPERRQPGAALEPARGTEVGARAPGPPSPVLRPGGARPVVCGAPVAVQDKPSTPRKGGKFLGDSGHPARTRCKSVTLMVPQARGARPATRLFSTGRYRHAERGGHPAGEKRGGIQTSPS